MADYRLRNHIPISGPATREPVDGSEPDMRISIGFTPKWFNRRLGIDFSQRWHLDPIYRYNALVKMKSYLYNVFPMFPYFEPRYENGIEKTCATISAVHGTELISLIYGLEVVYGSDTWPAARADRYLTREQIERLEPFDLLGNPVVVQLLEQMAIIENNFGPIHGYLNYQGILNIALRIRRNEIFFDMLEDQAFVHHLFGHIANTIMNLSKLVQEKQRRSGFYINLLSMSNCTVNMISPGLYKELVLPYDEMLSRNYERFGIHNCNWNVTPYLEAYRTIEKVGYLDMGIASDLLRARELFPDARRAILLHPVSLEGDSLASLNNDIRRIAGELAPCDIVLADIDATTPDSRICEFARMAGEGTGPS